MTMLSVITPALNKARFLPATLDSVAALRTPHEHIVVDGASDDGTVEVLEGRVDPSLSWTSEPDSGQTEAVNKGLARARGNLVAWLNADDTYLPAAVDRAIEHLVASPGTMAIYGGVHFTDEDGTVFRTHIPGRFRWRRYLMLGTYIPTQTIIFRRELLERAPRLNEAYADAADYDFYLRLFHGSRVEALPEPLVNFRYHAENKSTRDVWTQHDEALEVRLGWARNRLDRMAMVGAERLKRAILPRISSWPFPQPTGAARMRREGR